MNNNEKILKLLLLMAFSDKVYMEEEKEFIKIVSKKLDVTDEKLKSEESFNKLLIFLLLVVVLGLIFIVERLIKINSQNKLIEHQKAVVQQKNKILERLSLVVSKTENIILILDANGNVEWVNDSFEKLNNLTFDQLLIERGRNIVDVSNYKENY